MQLSWRCCTQHWWPTCKCAPSLASRLTTPNSFSITAIFFSSHICTTLFKRDVFPAPRKPVTSVTGMVVLRNPPRSSPGAPDVPGPSEIIPNTYRIAAATIPIPGSPAVKAIAGEGLEGCEYDLATVDLSNWRSSFADVDNLLLPTGSEIFCGWFNLKVLDERVPVGGRNAEMCAVSRLDGRDNDLTTHYIKRHLHDRRVCLVFFATFSK